MRAVDSALILIDMDVQGLQIFLAMECAVLRGHCFATLTAQQAGVVRSFASLAGFLEATSPRLDAPGCNTARGVLIAAMAGAVAGGPSAPRQLGSALSKRPGTIGVLVTRQVDAADLAPLLQHGLAALVAAGSPEATAQEIARLTPALLARADWRARQQQVNAQLARLTRREADVLASIAAGESSKLAGRRLGISPRTVEVHRASIMRRLGATSLAALLRLYFTANLDHNDDPLQAGSPWPRAAPFTREFLASAPAMAAR